LILGKSNNLKCASSKEPIHKILAHLKSRKVDPRAGPFEEQAALGTKQSMMTNKKVRK
jgi:hypothetical protein